MAWLLSCGRGSESRDQRVASSSFMLKGKALLRSACIAQKLHVVQEVKISVGKALIT